MINHPNRGNSPDALSRRLIKFHALEYIDITIRPGGVSARAIPHVGHPIVQARREEAYAKAGGDLSLKQATELTKGAMAPIAIAQGDSLAEALQALATKLREPE